MTPPSLHITAIGGLLDICMDPHVDPRGFLNA